MRKIVLLFIIFQFFASFARSSDSENCASTVAQAPNWVPVPNQQYNMSVIGKIQLSPGVFSVNENDILGAFVGTECRGVASPYASLGGILFLTIGSNVQSGETVTFKVYFAASDQIFDIVETIPFQNAGEVGTMANPFIFNYALPCTLGVAPSGQNVTYAPSGPVSFSVTTTCAWSATSDQAWCSVTPSGTGNGTITATCTQNYSVSQRTASITVSVQGLSPVTVTVVQAGAPGPPAWTPVPNLQFNMSVIGKIQLSPGAWSVNGNDIIGAFVGTECRGVASPFASLNGALFLTIGSNTSAASTVTFKLFLASTNEIIDISETMAFQSAGEVGTMANPFIFTFPMQNNVIIQSVTVNNGQSPCFNAYQTITVAGGGTSFLVKTGGAVNLIAGQKISFQPGTTVQPGGYLHAYITTTSGYCSQVPTSPGNITGEEPSLSSTREFPALEAYPNPATGMFTLEMKSAGILPEKDVTVYNIQGRVVLKSRFQGVKQEFSLENQPAGLYLVTVLCKEKLEMIKIVLQ